MGSAYKQPKKLFFKDDGIIPNSNYPLLLYRDVFSEREDAGAEWLEERFASNNWTNSWRWGIYPFHHYHSNTHEVLGVFSGSAEVLLGGEQGQKVKVQAGDVLVIPAGVGHECIRNDSDFSVVGAYPNGVEQDMNKGKENERPAADKKIASVPIPDTDPLFGENKGLVEIWKDIQNSGY